MYLKLPSARAFCLYFHMGANFGKFLAGSSQDCLYVTINENFVHIHGKNVFEITFGKGILLVCLGILAYSWQNTSRNITC